MIFIFETEIDTLFSNIDSSHYYIKSDVDDIDNALSAVVLNTHTKTAIDTLFFTSYPSLSFIADNF